MTLDELIVRLKETSAGTRDLDAAIADAVDGWPVADDPEWRIAPNGVPVHLRTIVSHYTTSLDAAMTLIPKRWSWRAGNLPSGRGFADLGTQVSLQCVVGATPALALCIAALKARRTLGRVKP